ncbi:hypothetical protein DCCM_2832 [Desulfocucumis palustris]|uniref:Uncharacterized protein n=1 Tax=Desulfocucumis palustris TaxID=1898651 RepID=A0A2L2XHL5_9FIRM|nr:hypothetical protein DCCM_2832 [Desulfocucumis palustris]
MLFKYLINFNSFCRILIPLFVKFLSNLILTKRDLYVALLFRKAIWG